MKKISAPSRERKANDGLGPRRTKRARAQIEIDPRLEYLFEREPVLRNLFFRMKVKPPALCPQLLNKDTPEPSRLVFGFLAMAVIYQQISVKAAGNIYKRYLDLFSRDQASHVFDSNAWANGPRPTEVISKPDEDLRAIGLPMRKIRYLKAISAALEGPIDPRALCEMSDEEIKKKLSSIPGIGPWTCDMFLMFVVRREDVFPISDLGVRKGIGKLFKFDENILKDFILGKKNKLVHSKIISIISERWMPYRSIASYLMWEAAGTYPPVKT